MRQTYMKDTIWDEMHDIVKDSDFQSPAILTPKGHLAMYGNIFDSHRCVCKTGKVKVALWASSG